VSERTADRRRTVFTLSIYWSCILLGLAIPGLSTIAVDVFKHHQSLGQAIHQWRIHLFAPGYNLFLVAIWNAVPFVLFAVFALLHLGWARLEEAGLYRRISGTLLAGLAAIGLSAWTHVMTLWFPDAQGALAYLFLPIVLAGVIPASYLIGWLGAFAYQKVRRTAPTRA